MNNKYDNLVLGLDIGISSVGWSLIDDETNNLVEFGVRRFEEATKAEDSRLNRGARRNNRRNTWRKQQLKDAFVDFKILEKNDYDLTGFMAFTSNHKKGNLDNNLAAVKDQTIYHTRLRGLSEELTKRELFLSLYNIVKTRGHFLIEDVDFLSDNNIEDADIEDSIISLFEQYVTFDVVKLNQFKQDVLLVMINDKIPARSITAIKKVGYVVDENGKENDKLEAMIKLLCGYSASMSKVDEIYKDKMTIKSLKSGDDADDFLTSFINIYDTIQTKKILKEFDYLSQKHVNILDKLKSFGHVTPEKLEEIPELNEFYDEIKAKMSRGDKKDDKFRFDSLKVVKNVENNYPNGLYLKEARDILKNQQRYDQYTNLITEDFINVVLEIISARIPYFMGPLSKEGKNAWINRNEGQVKYSYNYALKQGLFNEEDTIKQWKENMISHCTYLPDEYALPKQSMLLELFVILNDLNIYSVTDLEGNVRKLNTDEKILVINELFLNQSSVVTFKNIVELLPIKKFGAANNSNIVKFNKSFSLYHNIVSILPKLKIVDINQEINGLTDENSKLNQIENVIQTLVLYDDYINKKNVFIKQFNEDEAIKLAKLNGKDFASVSKKFLYDTVIDVDSNSIVEKLLIDDKEQMTIITNATNESGEPINFSSNKYLTKLEDNNKLDINLIMDGNKPFVPMARSVVRSLNETFKVYNQVVKDFGQPIRVVVETARDLGDFSTTQKVPAKHFDTIKKLYEDLVKQNKEIKIDSTLSDWNLISQYLISNKKKIELYIRQDGRDIITGNPIDLNNLYDYQIDHILPRGFGDNSKNNSILILGSINNLKDNRLPLEYIMLEKPELEPYFRKRVASLYERKMISSEKHKYLMMESTEEALGFISRNLVDTRYIIKEFTSVLQAYHNYNNISTKVVSLQGSYNALFRNALGIRKNRDLGDQHHAHDAAIITIVDKTLESFAPNYSSGNPISAKRYRENLKRIMIEFQEDGEMKKKGNHADSSIQTLKNMFRNAYGDSDIVLQIKAKKPLLSWRVSKKSSGELFNATLYSPKDSITEDMLVKYAKDLGLKLAGVNIKAQIVDEVGLEQFHQDIFKYSKQPLDIIGVNNDKRKFTSIKSVAVDVYKLTVKGKKKFFGVHIPKAIVVNGKINQEKYMKLVKYHYGYTELVDSDNNLITGAFKIRLFKNDMYYDTIRQELNLFNIGSIVNQRIETKRPNIYAYNDIYTIVEDCINKDDTGNNYLWNKDEINEYFDAIIEIYQEQGYKIQDNKEVVLNKAKELDKELKKVNKYQLFEVFAKSILDAQWKMNTKKVYGQNMPTINNISKEQDYQDGQFVKLAYSPLGIRVKYNNSKLIIEGKHKKVKKQEFTWQIK